MVALPIVEEEGVDAADDEGTTVTVAGLMSVRISVPFPSLASTWDDEENVMVAVPGSFPRNLIETACPLLPVYPGFGTMPLQETVPSSFENEGFCTQSDNTEFDVDTETTCKRSAGNDTIPEIAFIAWSVLDTHTVSVIVEPTLTVVFAGVKLSAAAEAAEGNRKSAAMSADNCMRKCNVMNSSWIAFPTLSSKERRLL